MQSSHSLAAHASHACHGGSRISPDPRRDGPHAGDGTEAPRGGRRKPAAPTVRELGSRQTSSSRARLGARSTRHRRGTSFAQARSEGKHVSGGRCSSGASDRLDGGSSESGLSGPSPVPILGARRGVGWRRRDPRDCCTMPSPRDQPGSRAPAYTAPYIAFRGTTVAFRSRRGDVRRYVAGGRHPRTRSHTSGGIEVDAPQCGGWLGPGAALLHHEPRQGGGIAEPFGAPTARVRVCRGKGRVVQPSPKAPARAQRAVVPGRAARVRCRILH
jgi:hypothetical protein